MRAQVAYFSAALAGASGMAFQVLALSSAGLLLGYGRSTALGLSAYLAAWALGAGAAGRSRAVPGRALVFAGALLFVVQPAAIAALHVDRARLGGAAVAGAAALAMIALPAFLQGAFLPFLARGGARVEALIVANFAGSLAGAFAVAERVTAAQGRIAAATVAGALAFLAGFISSPARARGIAHETQASAAPVATANEVRGALGVRAVVAIVALCTAMLAAHEWVGLRLGVLWLAGMQPALVAVMCASLTALLIGAAVVPLAVPRDRRGVAWVLALALVATAWPYAAPYALRAFANAKGGTGAELSVLEDVPRFWCALVLVGPPLVPLGGLVPVLHRSLVGESGARLARVFWPEAIGAALGVPLVHAFVVPRFGLAGALVACALAGLVAAAATLRASKLAFAVSCAACAGTLALATLARAPALASPPLSNPAFTIRSFREDRDFAVAVVDDGLIGERTLLTDGFRAAGTGRDYRYMRALGHLPVLLHPSPQRVAVLALGTGTTVGAVAMHAEVERIDVLEISRAVVESAPFFEEKNRGVLREGLPGLEREGDAQDRIVVQLGDGRATLARSARVYDVITMEPLLPDSPFAVYLYTREFYEIARRALKPGGLVCQWVPPHALSSQSFLALLRAFERSFEWSGAWLFGTQVVLIGSAEHGPSIVARRFETEDRALVGEMRELGLESRRDLAARFACRLVTHDDSFAPRELTDADPWIVHAARQRSVAVLADLPINLSALRVRASDSEPSWRWTAIESEHDALAGGAALRLARAAHARAEALLRGVRVPSERLSHVALETPDVAAREALVRARELLGDDPELDELAAEIAFLDDLRTGVALLRAGDDLAALEPLRRAVLARPERADVHLYAAIALTRVGDPNAERALDRALAQCPRIFETSAGRTAIALGLAPAVAR